MRRRWAADVLEAAGAVCLVVAAALVANWAAWLVAGVCLLAKAELDPPGGRR